MSEDNQNSGDLMEAAAPVEHEQTGDNSGGVQEESRMVPLDALQSERSQRQALQDELRVIKDHIALMQSQQSRPQQQQQDEMDGLSDDDVLTVGEAKKFLNKMNSQYQMSIKELKMTQQHPDYQDVVIKYLPEVLKQNPGLRQTLEKTQDYELAYYLAKNSEGYKSDNRQTKKSKEAERILENSQKTGSLSAVGTTSPMNTAKRYREMSDDEFRAFANRNRGAF